MISSRDKAKELVNKFIEHTQEWDELDGYVNDIYKAKQCALIAVDEVIENLVELSNGEFTFIHNVEYWQEVKKEILNL